jgi:cytochrome P450
VLAGPQANAFLLRGGERFLDNAAVYAGLAAELHAQNFPIATTGAWHRPLRRTLRPAFSREAIMHYVPRIVQPSRGGTTMRNAAHQGQTVTDEADECARRLLPPILAGHPSTTAAPAWIVPQLPRPAPRATGVEARR